MSLYTDGSIEPQVNTSGLSEEIDALTSIAISLKRIADILEHGALSENNVQTRHRDVIDVLQSIEMSSR